MSDVIRDRVEGAIGSRVEAASHNEYYEALYGELLRQARVYMSRQPAGHTLQPTALVSEAFVKLYRADAAAWTSSQHFLAVAARTMMNILVDHARHKGRKKRKADGERVPLDAVLVNLEEQAVSVIDLQDKLRALASLGPAEERAARVVELRVFGGLTMGEIAMYLETPKRTVERDLRFAKAWLHRELELGHNDLGHRSL